MGASGLGSLLVREGLLTDQDHGTIRRTSGQDSNAFAKGVLALGLLDETELAAFLADRTHHKVVGKDLFAAAEPSAMSFLDVHLLTRLEVLPLQISDTHMVVAMADPLDKSVIRQLEFFTGKRVTPVISTFTQIYEGLRKILPAFKPASSPLETLLANHATSASNRVRLSRTLDPERLRRAIDEQAGSTSAPDDWDSDASEAVPTSQSARGSHDTSDEDIDLGDVDIGADPDLAMGDDSGEVDLGGLTSLDGDDTSGTADELLSQDRDDLSGLEDMGSGELEDLDLDMSGDGSDGLSGGDAALAELANDDELFGGGVPKPALAAAAGAVAPSASTSMEEDGGDMLGSIGDGEVAGGDLGLDGPPADMDLADLGLDMAGDAMALDTPEEPAVESMEGEIAAGDLDEEPAIDDMGLEEMTAGVEAGLEAAEDFDDLKLNDADSADDLADLTDPDMGGDGDDLLKELDESGEELESGDSLAAADSFGDTDPRADLGGDNAPLTASDSFGEDAEGADPFADLGVDSLGEDGGDADPLADLGGDEADPLSDDDPLADFGDDDVSLVAADPLSDDGFGGEGTNENFDASTHPDEVGPVTSAAQAESSDFHIAALNEGLMRLSLAFSSEDACEAATAALQGPLANGVIFSSSDKKLTALFGWQRLDGAPKPLSQKDLVAFGGSGFNKIADRLAAGAWSDFRPPEGSPFKAWGLPGHTFAAARTQSRETTLILVGCLETATNGNPDFQETALSVLAALAPKLSA